jgi:phospholipid/cholesterol/gamma-HCH transport system substrate-binding protein
MKKTSVEAVVGIFMVAGILCLAYLSIKLGKLELMGGDFYDLNATFNSVSGLKAGASVEIAGVEIGRVNRIDLDPSKGYEARVFFRMQTGVKLTDDSIASVRTRGIIGDKYILIKPGGSEKLLAPGGKIRETESAVDLEQLISEYIHGKI